MGDPGPLGGGEGSALQPSTHTHYPQRNFFHPRIYTDRGLCRCQRSLFSPAFRGGTLRHSRNCNSPVPACANRKSGTRQALPIPSAPTPLPGSRAPALIPGVIVRTDPSSSVETVSATDDVTELRITSGRANVSVRHPEHNTQILVDLPGGQTALLKDGLYTFNASTNTVRVLKGEASVFPGTSNAEVKVKEDHQFTFGASPRATEVSFTQARTDLIPGTPARSNYGDGPYRPYGYALSLPVFLLPPLRLLPLWLLWFSPTAGGATVYPFGFGIGFGYFGGFRGGFHHFH